MATFVERQSRLTVVKHLESRSSQAMTMAMLELAKQLGPKLKTITVDHGKEFANYREMEEQTGINLYFAHAYSPSSETYSAPCPGGCLDGGAG